MPRRRSPAAAPAPGAAAPTALRIALDRVGDRWLLLIVEALGDGPRRFGDLADEVGAAPNILTDRLRRLEVEGLVVSQPYSERPVRLEYRLTAAGAELVDALLGLAGWGAAQEGLPAQRFHDACGTPIELRPWCPTCDRPVERDESPGTYEL